jgi:Flp pilus assembly pilin Flp
MHRIRRPIFDRLNRMAGEESGQTQTEYLMIVGLMAAVIVTVFTVMFWPTIRSGVTELVDQIERSITGGGIS